MLRRIRPALAGEVLDVGDLKLDAAAHRVTRRAAAGGISARPNSACCKFFMEHPGRVFSRGQLLDAVWGTDSDIELRTVDVHIRRLRKAIELRRRARSDPDGTLGRLRAGSGLAAIAPTAPAAGLIEVEVIAMGGVVFGRQRRAEYVAGLLVDHAQEGGFVPSSRPVLQHADPPAVG